MISANDGNFYIDGKKLATHKKYDIYRYDAVNVSWVPAGLYYDPTTGQWDRLNVKNAFYGNEYTSAANTQQAFRLHMRKLFENNIGKYVDTDDISFH
jgi:hypothetical protein